MTIGLLYFHLLKGISKGVSDEIVVNIAIAIIGLLNPIKI